MAANLTPNYHPGGVPNGTTNYSPYYRQLYLDDRDRAQAKFAVDVKVLNNLTVTPTFNVKNDTYIFSTKPGRSDQRPILRRWNRGGLCRHSRRHVPVFLHERTAQPERRVGR